MNVASPSRKTHDVSIPAGWGVDRLSCGNPARNEADRLTACLKPLVGQGADVLVVANNCTDATIALTLASGAAVIDCTIAERGRWRCAVVGGSQHPA
ncbi:MAG: hypothetical protein H7173_09325 [Rhodoferax sp.]|nr:hypothetical protein [Pseudorhodobacter sp.]